jgi:hypothetical protein
MEKSIPPEELTEEKEKRKTQEYMKLYRKNNKKKIKENNLKWHNYY